MTYDALTKAGVPLFAYGNFITVAINFIILAFIIFIMVKQINRLKKDAPPAPPAAPPEDVVLLREIRDALKNALKTRADRAPVGRRLARCVLKCRPSGRFWPSIPRAHAGSWRYAQRTCAGRRRAS